MENFALIALVEELKTRTGEMVVRRVVQHHRRGFLLQTRSARIPALKLSLDSHQPVIYVSQHHPPIEAVTSEFLLLLRKHLTSARLLDIEKRLSERIVELKFKTRLPAKELETVTLIAELLPNSPNLFLLDGARRVLGSVAAPHARRGIAPYGEYLYPSSSKTRLELFRGDDLAWFDEEGFAKDSKNWLIRNVSGMGPVFAGEILRLQSAAGLSLPEQMRITLGNLLAPGSTAWIYSERPLSIIRERRDVDALRKAILSPIPLDSLGRGHSEQTCPGILEATRIVSDELESLILLNQAKAPRIRQLRGRMRRIRHQETRLLSRLRRYEEADTMQANAQLLLASGAPMDRRHESVAVIDYFGDRPKKRRIVLDPTRTLRENIDEMFKQYRKAGRGLALVRKQIATLKDQEAALQAESDRIHSIGTWEAWTAWKASTVPRRSKPGQGKPFRGNRRRRSVRLEGHEVLVGRSSRENDELTFDVATGDDFWFHVAGYSGSHVIVRNPAKEEELGDSILVKAAELAAYYSQARNSKKVEVHYTRRKFVSKPRKAKAGLVRLREFRTVTVEPRNWTARSSENTDSDNGRG